MHIAVPPTMLLVGLASGLPIGFVMLLSGFVGMCLMRGFAVGMQTLATMPYEATANYIYAVIPLFILTGQLAGAAGVSRRAYDAAYRWMGRLPGGLAIASVGACAAFAATSGSTVATAATVGRIAIPEMERFGYSSRVATGVVAAACTLGTMIPPSTSMVIYGIVTEQPIGPLLMAGLIPGIISAFIYIAGIVIYAKVWPHNAPRGKSFSWKEKLEPMPKGMIPVAILFTIIVGGIYAGVFTPSEAASFGAFAAIIIALVLRTKSRAMGHAFIDTGRVTAMIFLILIGGFFFSRYIVMTGMVGAVTIWLTDLTLNRYVILMGFMALYVFLGMWLDPISMLLITIPFVYPTIVELGFNPIWFGVLYTKMVEVANITPPVGVNVYIIKGIAPHVSLEDIFKGIGMFVIMDIFTLALLIAFPVLSLFLPETMMVK